MTDAVIDRFAVRWQLPAAQSHEDAEALLEALLDEALAEALAGVVTADEQVAIASVRVPPVRVSIGHTDEAARAWAAQVASAVAGQLAAGGPGVVRHANRPAALLDLVLRACAGDTSRLWAWRRLGLWPDDARDASETDPARAVFGALMGQPTAVAPVLAAAARRGALTRLVALLGPGHLRQLAATSWQSLGGAEDVSATVAPAPRRLASADPADAAPASAAPFLPAGVQGRLPPPGYALALLSGSPYDDMIRSASDARLRTALTALALADAVPGRVAVHGAALLRSALSEGVAASRRPPTAVRGDDDERSPWAAQSRGRESSSTAAPALLGECDRHTAREVAAPLVHPVTANAGLLFCLHLATPLRCLAGSYEPDGSGTRWAMHLLGRELLRRSAPRLGEPAVNDPALLAFCGLPPSVRPPAAPANVDPAEARHATARLADLTVRELRDRLAGRAPARQPQTALLAQVLHRRGEIAAFPGWLEVRLDLDDVSVDLRAAGLDLDPGWLPALGCIVRFRYV
ncbi:hypothetical protein [Streptomyces coerulescens]|uniref:Uncharacterized protein n=1 Tax=Streptomyces coerulescens TaxID=29304 RepID=A0ABW0CX29_STRCD